VLVFEQPNDPGVEPVGTLWIDTDEQPPIWVSGPPLVASLPDSPYDGQEVNLLADATAGVVWHLRYRAASASAYKWEFAGGARLSAEAAAELSTASGSYVDGGVAVTVPRAGEYEIELGAGFRNDGGWQTLLSVKYGAAAAVDADAVSNGFYASGTEAWPGSRSRLLPSRVCAAGEVRLYYRANGGTARVSNRYLALLPRRVS
jgi:hypothetical protein